jgi:RND family efflux transporter MFP subunit
MNTQLNGTGGDQFRTLRLRSSAIMLAFSIPAIISGCSNTVSPAPVESKVDAETGKAILRLPITVVKVESLTESLSLPGVVYALPDQSVKVSPGVTGKIIAVKAVPGQHVEKGDVIALLDNRQLRDAVNQAHAKVLVARAGVEQAKTNLLLAQNTQDRTAKLVQQEVAAEKDLVAAKSQVETAKAQLVAANAQVEDALAAEQAAHAQLTYTTVKSPIAGVVAQRFLNTSDSADTLTPIAQIVNLSRVIVEAALPTSQPAKINPGQNATITVKALPGRQLVGLVQSINPVTDNQGTTIGIRIACNNPDYALKEGMPVLVSIVTGQHPHALTVPTTAVVNDPQAPDKKMVYVYKGGKISRVAVTLGIERNQRQQILTGLTAGEQIVASSAYGIPDGTEVEAESEPLHGNPQVTSKSD